MTCSVCKKDFLPVSFNTNTVADLCKSCAKETVHSFIFFCQNCGTYEILDKEIAIMFAPNHDVKRQLLLLKNENVIIEQDSCVTCVGVHVC